MMKSTGLVSLLVVALLAGPQFAAGKGIGMMPVATGKGGGDVNVDVQCSQACKNECIPVPNKVCNDVPYTTQVCNQVAVQMSKQVCNRVCTQTQTYTQTVTSGKGKGGMPIVTYGKGSRRLFGTDGLIGLGKAAIALAAGKGKGVTPVVATVAAPAPAVNCQDVCNDVPYTAYQNQCNPVTQTKSVCDIVYQQSCNQVCKPVCQKITTVTTTTTQSLGKGMPVMLGKGKH